MIIADANLIGYLFLTSDRSETAQKAFLRDSEWAAPMLWRSEFSNVLAMYVRKEILRLEEAYRLIENSRYLMFGREFEIDSYHVLQLATASRCTAYDCEYVALAYALDVPLVTVDRQILAQFPERAIALDIFANS
jgi:predicted nucleic acid-binding protein